MGATMKMNWYIMKNIMYVIVLAILVAFFILADKAGIKAVIGCLGLLLFSEWTYLIDEQEIKRRRIVAERWNQIDDPR